MAQLPRTAVTARGHPAMLSKSPQGGKLVRLRLHNGSLGRVVAHVYAPGQGPPSQPRAVIIDIPAYNGPRWHPLLPKTWVPIVAEEAATARGP